MSDRLVGTALVGAHGALGLLPEPARRAAGRALGSGARALGVRRGIGEAHLRASFPDRAEEWIAATLRRCYRHFGEEIALLAGGVRGVRSALEATRVPDDVARAIAGLGTADRGAVIVTGHLGNWELAAALLAAAGRPVTTVARRHAVEWDGRLQSARKALGIQTLSHRDSPLRLARTLERGGVVALVADQHAPRGGVRTPFFGRPAWTWLGPARLSIATGAPLFFGALTRERGGYAAELRAVEAAGTDDRAVALTRAWLAALEAAIVRDPGQYLWFHRKWKDRRGAAGRNDGPDRRYHEPNDGDEATGDLHWNTGS